MGASAAMVQRGREEVGKRRGTQGWLSLELLLLLLMRMWLCLWWEMWADWFLTETHIKHSHEDVQINKK